MVHFELTHQRGDLLNQTYLDWVVRIFHTGSDTDSPICGRHRVYYDDPQLEKSHGSPIRDHYRIGIRFSDQTMVLEEVREMSSQQKVAVRHGLT